MDHRELVNLGLSDKESKVYLASLELGKSSVQKIAQRADVKRVTTYVILESLMAKGLASSVVENKKQYFFAESPEKLTLLFRDEEAMIKRKQEYLEGILPELKSLNILDKNSRPVIRYFEGKEGLRSMRDEVFIDKNAEEPVRTFYSVDLLRSNFSEEERERVRSRRFKEKVKTKVLYNFKNDVLSSDEISTRKKVSEEMFPMEADIAVFGNRVRIAIMNNLSGMIIDSKEVAKTLKSIFELAWIGADVVAKEKEIELKKDNAIVKEKEGLQE